MHLHYLCPVMNSKGKINHLITHAELDENDQSQSFCWAIPTDLEGNCHNSYYANAQYRKTSKSATLILIANKFSLKLHVHNKTYEFAITKNLVPYRGNMLHNDFGNKFRVVNPLFDNDALYEAHDGLYLYGVGFDGYKKKHGDKVKTG